MIDHDSWLNAQLNRYLDENDRADAYAAYREKVVGRLIEKFRDDAGVCADVLSEALSGDDGFAPMIALAQGKDPVFCSLCRALVKAGIATKADREADAEIEAEVESARQDEADCRSDD